LRLRGTSTETSAKRIGCGVSFLTAFNERIEKTMPGQKWSRQEDTLLKQLSLQENLSDAEISKVLPRSKTAIMHRRKKVLGIDIRVRWTEEEDAHLAKLLTDTDKTLAEIGNLLNRSEEAVGRRKERLGLMHPRGKLCKNAPADIAQLVKFKLAGWTHQAIAEVFQTHPSYISNLLTANGFMYFSSISQNAQKRYSEWTELEVHRLRECLKRGVLLQHIYFAFPHRSKNAIHFKIKQITRHWSSPAEQAERKRLREKHMEWRVY